MFIVSVAVVRLTINGKKHMGVDLLTPIYDRNEHIIDKRCFTMHQFFKLHQVNLNFTKEFLLNCNLKTNTT